jgi:carbonic anhydrase/acetyltransferase-like protein (isoleucine patch superfamily)
MIRTYGVHRPNVRAAAFVHDSAEVIGRVALGKDSSIWPFCVLRGDVDAVKIGARTNIQDLTVIHCRETMPAVIGEGVTVGHRVIIHGAKIGDGCLIGMGAIVMEATIGPRCLVAAGALILQGQKFPAGHLILGSPAKAVRKLTPKELASLAKSARDYVGHAKRHKATSKVVFG